jgi:hypothetical protein
MALLELAKIRRDGGTQPRAHGVDYGVVDEYADLMKEGRVFPPIKVTFDGSEYWLVDGFHRVEAAEEAGLTEFECDVTAGTLADAQWQSYSVNAAHGLPRTNADKRRAVKAALSHARGHELSDRAIADHVGCDHKTVGAVRRELEAAGEVPQATDRVGRDGQVRSISEAVRPETPPVPEVPQEFWPLPDENGIFDDAQAELLVESFGRGQRQASINLLQVNVAEWASGWSVSLSEKGGVGASEPLVFRWKYRSRKDAIEWAAKSIIQWCRRNREGRPKSQLEAIDHFIAWAMELAGFSAAELQVWDEEEAQERRRAIQEAAEAVMAPLLDLPLSEADLDLPAGVELSEVIAVILRPADDAPEWFRSDAERFVKSAEAMQAMVSKITGLVGEESERAA